MVIQAQRRGIPMTHLALDDAAVRGCWERDLVLVRPDQHVAWRDDTPPEYWDAVLDRVSGRESGLAVADQVNLGAWSADRPAPVGGPAST